MSSFSWRISPLYNSLFLSLSSFSWYIMRKICWHGAKNISYKISGKILFTYILFKINFKKILVPNILSLSTRIKHFAFSYNCCIFIRSPAQVYREYFLANCLHTLCNVKWEPLIEIPNDVIFNFLLCFQSLFDIFFTVIHPKSLFG
jgi:hypothetical protein